MLELNNIAVDPKKSRKGVWVDIMGAKFKIARFNNREAEAARSEEMLKLYNELNDNKANRTKEKDAELETSYTKAQARVMAEHVLLDWKGIAINGKEVKYSVKKATEILADPRYEDLYMAILKEAIKHENYTAKNEGAVKKDAKSTSSS